jgi:hypothetical protein
MPTVIPIRPSTPLSRVPQSSADAGFLPIVLFSSVGLVVSFAAVILGELGAWH